MRPRRLRFAPGLDIFWDLTRVHRIASHALGGPGQFCTAQRQLRRAEVRPVQRPQRHLRQAHGTEAARAPPLCDTCDAQDADGAGL